MIKLKCSKCKNFFERRSGNVKKYQINYFCSSKCRTEFRQKRPKTFKCLNCKSIQLNPKGQNKKFCNQSCAASYNNTHKTSGVRVSKLELWLQKKLIKMYSKLKIHFNRKDTINSELDIYIPKLKLAFELNGIFHYEPIYGSKKLASIQNNDSRKFQACLESGIELVLIDTSLQKYFKEQTSQKFLDIIINIINSKLER